jgi:hypothetical protein
MTHKNKPPFVRPNIDVDTLETMKPNSQKGKKVFKIKSSNLTNHLIVKKRQKKTTSISGLNCSNPSNNSNLDNSEK